MLKKYNLNQAVDYYCNRLEELSEYSKKIKTNLYFLQSEELISNTDQVLNGISKFLKLEFPLANMYETFRFTGRIGHGDSSENIQKGTIVQTKNDVKSNYDYETKDKIWSKYMLCKNSYENISE